MNVTFIVGNGLDISLGLETSYAQFYEHVEKNKPLTENQIYSAIRKDPSTWGDFELALGAHTQLIEGFSAKERTEASTKLHESFDEVLGDLGDYLQERSNIFVKNKPRYIMSISDFYTGLLGESWRKVTGVLGGQVMDASFITLNYTNTLEELLFPERQLMERRKIRINQIHHAHGKLTEYITMGVSNESQISAALVGDSRDDLIKPRLLESMGDDILATTKVLIERSSIIVLYGASLGETDEYIWQQVIDWLATSEDRYVIIHDYNEEYLKNPTRNPSRIKQLDNEARNRLLRHSESLTDEDKVNLRSQILVVRNTSKLFKP